MSEAPAEEPVYMTVPEIAAKLRLSKMTVYRLIHAGALGALKVGKTFRVTEVEYRAYLARNTTEATQ